MGREAGNWLEAYMELTDNSEPSALFRRWSGISIIAACMGRKCSVLWGNKPLYPNFYIVLVGTSGARKGTAVGQAMRFLADPILNIRLATDSTSRANFLRDFSESTEHFTLPDGKTIAHSSLTVCAPEFTTFLGYGNMQLITDLLDLYDTEKNPWVHKTLGNDARTITGPFINLLAATTPDLLRSSLPPEVVIGGGLFARTMLIYSDKREKKIVNEFETNEEVELRTRMLHDLYNIALVGGDWKISASCVSFYEDWYNVFEEEVECLDPKFSGYFNRKPTALKKLAFIHAVARGDDYTINRSDIENALETLTLTEGRMYYALRGIGRNQHAAVLASLMSFLALKGEVSFSEIMYRYRDEVTKFELLKILEGMESFHYCTSVSGVYGVEKIIYNKGFNNGHNTRGV